MNSSEYRMLDLYKLKDNKIEDMIEHIKFLYKDLTKYRKFYINVITSRLKNVLKYDSDELEEMIEGINDAIKYEKYDKELINDFYGLELNEKYEFNLDRQKLDIILNVNESKKIYKELLEKIDIAFQEASINWLNNEL